ncbi:MAG: MFS transporter [Bryobacterales bacterium]|nr:MFS transporter [Bryobacterales bacterium]
MENNRTASATGKPTHARYWVIVFAVALSVITYIDRVCISQAAPFIKRDLHLSSVEIGYAFGAFGIAYALFEIPGGWLGDWVGPRRVLLRIVVWWSFFTAATGWAWNHVSLIVTRFMFGAGEAGCFPNLTKAFTTWLPEHERVRAQGIMWMATRWGGAFTPALVVLVFKFIHWRRSFELFGAIGIVWAIFFYRWFRDNPARHPSVNQAELALLEGAEQRAGSHGDVPWRTMLTMPTVWLLWVQYFCLSWGWSFYITWLPSYLQQARGMDLSTSAIFAGLPLFFGGIGCSLSGFAMRHIARRVGGESNARRLVACTGMFGAGALLIISTNLTNAGWAVVAMALASLSNDICMPPAWGACMDVGGRYAGTLSGSMNMMGNAGGAVAPVVVGYLLSLGQQNWPLTFYISAGIYFAGVFAWYFIDPVTPMKGA